MNLYICDKCQKVWESWYIINEKGRDRRKKIWHYDYLENFPKLQTVRTCPECSNSKKFIGAKELFD